MIASTHNHSTGSDGKLSPEDLVKKALDLGWEYLYFTDHYKTRKYFPTKYYLKYFSEDYIDEIKELQKKYANKINIFFGVEMNWVERELDWTKKELEKQEYGYVLGSIHEFFHEGGELCGLEWGKEEWVRLAKLFGGPKEFVKEYYRQIRLMIKSRLFDSAAHMDHIKLYNQEGDLFDEEEEWYKKEVLECLDLMKENNLALEINHSGIRKCGTVFPSEWIIKEANKREIDITLGLDAHEENHYKKDYLDELVSIAKKAGYTEAVRFEKRKRIEFDI